MSGRPADKDEARRWVEEIGRQRGHVSAETLAQLDTNGRREIEQVVQGMGTLLGNSIRILALQLYASNARFVFELLQNADDNQYSVARAAELTPHVKFQIYHNRIIVECNEDGFTRENLEAICAVNQSSKAASEGYIGQKGIGFKSVFMAAWKVHIRSGHFSFHFRHRPNDPDMGMGMIRPIWDEDESLEEMDYPLTRFVLFLHDEGDPTKLASDRENISDQFRTLSATLLLFPKNIEYIEVEMYDQDGLFESAMTVYINKSVFGKNLVVLETSRTYLDEEEDYEQQTYHVTKHMATNLDKNENRKYSKEEEESRTYRTSEIVLAFPLDADMGPVIEEQEVFAFLPLRHMGFNFIIQADFVTQANRQDIITNSPRNAGLIDGAADAFVKAVLQFCEDDQLQYLWMRYLPEEGSFPWNRFWRRLLDGIKTRLRRTPVMRPFAQPSLLRCISEVVRRWPQHNDQHGNPLFPDLRPKFWLAAGYASHDLALLTAYGLQNPAMESILRAVRLDLKSGTSVMKSPATSNDWLSRAARLIDKSFANKWQNRIDEIRLMELIPLYDGRWVSAASGTIYYPATDRGVRVPRDLRDLRLVSPTAAANADRRTLFDHLGVKSPTAGDIRPSILEMYRYRDTRSRLTLEISRDHLRFLYLTDEDRDGDALSCVLRVYGQDGHLRNPSKDDVYFWDNNPYGAKSLLGAEGARDLGVFFLSLKYPIENPPDTPSGAELSWVEWFCDYLGIRRSVRLVARDNRALSGEFAYVAQHQPAALLGFLEHVWPSEGATVLANVILKNALMDTQILCEHGNQERLRNAYLPLPALKEACLRFMDQGEYFPFAQPPRPDCDFSTPFWNAVGFRRSDDIDFRLAILGSLKDAHVVATTISRPRRIVDLYQFIEATCMQSLDHAGAAAKIREFFAGQLIFIPASSFHGDASWVLIKDCFWEAPDCAITRAPLRSCYSHAFGEEVANVLTGFFTRTLKIPNMDWTHAIEELVVIKNRPSSGQLAKVRRLYLMLQERVPADEEPDNYQIRNRFEEHALVYVEQGGASGWFKPSACLWASATSIMDRPAISGLYGDLEDLFVKKLGIQSLDLTLLHAELLKMPERGASVEDVTQALWALNAFLGAEDGSHPPSPDRLLQKKLLPVVRADGEVCLTSARTDFAIHDRDDYYEMFCDSAAFLCFSLQEVHRLRPLLTWARLEPRYLSKCVSEVSKVRGGFTRRISSPKNDVRLKAYGLVRAAVTYNSPRCTAGPQRLYDLLHGAITVETKGISSTLVLRLNGTQHEFRMASSELHIDDDDGLTIYVPEDAEDQELCFMSKLPHRLAGWLMTDPTSGVVTKVEDAMVSAVKSILGSSLGALPRVLTAEGIAEIDIPYPSEWDDAVSPSSEMAELPLAAGSDFPTPITDFPTPITDLDYYNERVGGRSSTTYAMPPVRFDSSSVAGIQYKRLLEMVVRVARSTMEIPNFGDPELSSLFHSLTVDEGDVFDGLGTLYFPSVAERHVKIGAAGELLVLELLSRLEPRLPGFGLHSWKSRIRRHVHVHADYTDLEPWTGVETSDIVYRDTDGVFTSALIDRGYLSDAEIWRDRRPKYYIEVKTTTDACATPFFVSAAQYDRMQQSTNGPSGDQNQDVVYVIFRVYNLGRQSMGLRIYVDPEEHRQQGKLRFTTDKWTVVPSTTAQQPL